MRTADYSLIKDCIDSNLRFAAFCPPGQKKFAILLQTTNKLHEIKSIDKLDTEKGFVFVPFNRNSSHKNIIIKDDIVLKEGELILNPDLIFSLVNKDGSDNAQQPKFTSIDEYASQFSICYNLLSEGSLQKIVLSRMVPYKIVSEFDISSLFRELNLSYPDAFTYVFNTPETGCWLGASPEQLLKVSNDKAYTVSLAGTQKCDEHNIDDISWGEKEVVEQKFVTDYIDNLLNNYVDKSLIVKENITVKAGEILHLKTLFSFPSSSIKNKIGEFISSLHPTPAVCGLPKDIALETIISTETHDREYYSGFLGIMNIQNSTDLYVNLRCLKVHKNYLCIYAGGGLTIDSDPEKEWEETNFKANTLISVLNKLKQNKNDLS